MFGDPRFKAFNFEIGVTTDFSSNSPKLRLSALGYLLDNGFLKDVSRTPEDLVKWADAFVDYVTQGSEEFMQALQALEDKQDPAEDTKPDTENINFDNGNSPYL